MFTAVSRVQVRGLLMGQQFGDGVDGVTHVLAAAKVAGEGPPVLEVSDAVLDSDTPRGVRLALRLVHFLTPVRCVLRSPPASHDRSVRTNAGTARRARRSPCGVWRWWRSRPQRTRLLLRSRSCSPRGAPSRRRTVRPGSQARPACGGWASWGLTDPVVDDEAPLGHVRGPAPVVGAGVLGGVAAVDEDVLEQRRSAGKGWEKAKEIAGAVAGGGVLVGHRTAAALGVHRQTL
jgi:hypothetical protein